MERRDVAVRVEDGGDGGGGGGKIWRESSYDFWHDTGKQSDSGFDFTDSANKNTEGKDPPSKLIGQFLHKQKASGEVCLDMDLEMAELQNDPSSVPPRTNTSTTNTPRSSLPPVAESPSPTHRVSFDPNPPGSGAGSAEPIRRRSQFKDSPQKEELGGVDGGGGEVVRCSSRDGSSFQRKSSLLKEKTKSRLMDPPERMGRSGQIRSGQIRSGQVKSGFIGKGGNNNEEEEDDPLLEEDIPDELKKDKLDFWVILEWVSLVLIIGALVCSLTIPFLKKKSLWKMRLWKWEVLVLVLICGRLVSSWIVRIIVFFIERNFLLRKRVLYFVYGVRKAVQNCLWLGLVLIAWHYLFNEKVERETSSKVVKTVTKILVCLLVGVLLWLVKTLMVKVLASSFHVSTFFDRIQESLFNQYVIETLSGPPLIEIQRNEEEEEKLAEEVRKLQNAGVTVPSGLKIPTSSSPGSGRVIGSGMLQRSPRVLNPKSPRLSRTSSSKGGEEGITIDHLHKLNPKNVSAWNMKRLINIVRHGALSTLDEQIQDSAHEDENATKIRSEYEAKSAARKIFHNVARRGSRYIYLEDIMRFMREDEALKAMSLFEGASESMKISKSALKDWVVNAFRERRALALTLNDTKTAVNKLHRMVNILVGIIIVIVWLLILGIATTKFLLFLSSQLVVVAFIFGNTCKTVFEAIIFLFVMHPFDVGDRCEIEGVQMVVEEMNILTTVFLRYDNQKIVYPNSVLATKAISNYYRSPDMGDVIEFCIHITTPADKIAQMKQRITSYIENKKDHWYPAPMIILKDMEYLNMVRIAIWPTHRMNHQDMGERFTRRSLLIDEIIKMCKEMDIQHRMYPLDVNIRTLPPLASERIPQGWVSNVS
ncbi:mechanosensitive ion channel protein 6 [Tripterygium wilfordii]|uniref:Mechanosensitive ion channel protein n=1 Tax=Tripterygium wilfordii TaxID=458696 RepID=A0A7J7C2C0_TRIWF|nr:mechanosensitive ion channel protein 6-like [Tripterygium wilfordii]KAF5728241.1 mechanosensitive ion channel protein 6 [Tripterygium wilfordii]